MQNTRRIGREPITVIVTAALAAFFPAPACVAQTATFTTLYNFQGSPDGKAPQASLILDSNGNLYGTTYRGGASNQGTVFELTPPSIAGSTWTETVLHSFTGAPDGSYPAAGLTFGTGSNAGTLFGATLRGGTGAADGGTVFELAPPAVAGVAWTETAIYSFSGGGRAGRHGTGSPDGTLFIDSKGTIYGTTHGNCFSTIMHPSEVFEVVPPSAPGGTWTERTLFNFEMDPTVNRGGGGGAEGVCPAAGIVSQAGALYGTTFFGPNGITNPCNAGFGCGAAYQLNPPVAAGSVWTGTLLHAFIGPPDGAFLQAPLTPGPGGVFYGTTTAGGTSSQCAGIAGETGCGTVFELTPPATTGGPWTETVLYSFTGTNGDGAYPFAGVTLGPNGVLYGTTEYGGSATTGSPCTNAGASGCGAIFQLAPPATPGGAWTETVLYSFSGQNSDGSLPLAGLVAGPGNVLYGTTSAGGTAGAGIVFSLTLN